MSKRKRLDIRLEEDLDNFVRQSARNLGYINRSSYVRDILSRERLNVRKRRR